MQGNPSAGIKRIEFTKVVPFVGSFLSLDMEQPHERRYSAAILDGVRYPQMDIDTMIYQRFIQRGDFVLDAGASIGITALQALNAGADSIVCVEPIPELLERIKSLYHPKISCVEAAIAHGKQTVNLALSIAHNQGSSASPILINKFRSLFGRSISRREVLVKTIDALVNEFGAFDVWKLDVEGLEAEALRSGSHSLRNSPPRVIIAEVYDEVRREFFNLVTKTHPFGRRVFINPADYTILLMDPAEADLRIANFRRTRTSPMYVFVADALFFDNAFTERENAK